MPIRLFLQAFSRFQSRALFAGLGVCALLATTGCSGDDDDDDDDDDNGGESGAAGDTGSGGSTSGSGGTSGGEGGTSGSGGTNGGKGGTSGSGGTNGGKGGTSGTSGTSGKGGTSGTSGTSGAPPDIDELPPAEEADWTVFVYGHGDHNLSNSLLADMGEMAKANLGEAGSVNVLVLADWNASQQIAGSDPPQNFPDGVQLYRVPGGGEDLEVVAEGSEQNLDDPGVLTSIVTDVFKAYPARRHGVILWDHGGSWSGGFGSDTDNGTNPSPTAMPAEAIPPAILDGLAAAEITGEPPLEFVAFDTCLMAGAETAYPFRQLASVYFGNAEIDYGNGWDYTATFSYLAANVDVAMKTFAKAEVMHWNDHHENESANDALLRSHAALDLTKLEAFATATNALTSALGESSSFDPIELGRAGFFALPPYASQFENAGSSLPGLHDAGQVLAALSQGSSDPAVASAATDANAALKDLLLATSQGTLRTDAEQSGLHIELGLATTLTPDKRAEYGTRAASWDGASGWHSVLSTLASAADSEGPVYTHSVDNAEAAGPSAPPLLHFTCDDADVAKASVYLGTQLDSGQIVLLGLAGATPVNPEEGYEYGWSGTIAALSDDQPAMLDIWLDTGSADGDTVLMVPGLLTGASSEPLTTYLVFPSSENNASIAVVSFGSVASTLSVTELAESAPDATFSPLYYVIDPSTGSSELQQGNPLPMPSSGAFELHPVAAQPGNYYYFSMLTDVWGNTGVQADVFNLEEPLAD